MVKQQKRAKAHRGTRKRRRAALSLFLLAVLCASTLSFGGIAFARAPEYGEAAGNTASPASLADESSDPVTPGEEDQAQPTDPSDPADPGDAEGGSAGETASTDPADPGDGDEMRAADPDDAETDDDLSDEENADGEEDPEESEQEEEEDPEDAEADEEELPEPEPEEVVEVADEDIAADAVLEAYIREHIDPAYVGSVDQMELVNGLVVKNTLMDGSLVSAGDTIDSVMHGVEGDDISQYAKLLGQVESLVAVYDVCEDSSYYVASANTMAEHAVVWDALFALYDNDGHAVSGCHYDTATGLAYIPKSLYLNENGTYEICRIQLQLMQVIGGSLGDVTSDVLSSTIREGDADVDVYRTSENIFEMETTAQVEAGLDPDDMLVSVNGVPTTDYAYSAASGEITLAKSSAAVQTLSVQTDAGEAAAAAGISTYSTSGGYASMQTSQSGAVIELPSWVTVGTGLSGTIPVAYYYGSYKGWDAGDSYAYVYDFDGNGVSDSDINNLYKMVTSDAAFDDGGGTAVLRSSYLLFKVMFGSAGADSFCYDTQVLSRNTYQGSVEPVGETVDLSTLSDLAITCGHVTESGVLIEGDNSTLPDGNGDERLVFLRCLWISDAEDEAVFAVVGGSDRLSRHAGSSESYSQAGVGMVKFRTVWAPEKDSLQLCKTSANPSVTDENGCYSLEDAVYTVYADEACKTSVKNEDNTDVTLTTDANGNSNPVTLLADKYWVKETTTPAGYRADPNVYEVELTGNNTEDHPFVLEVAEEPLYDTGLIRIDKVDRETGASVPLATASLAGAQFTVCFYAGDYAEDELDGLAPAKTWVIETRETDDGYAALLDDTCLVSGDDWYYTPGGTTVLPLGTYTIRETQAPEGYKIKGTFTAADGTGVSAGDAYYTRLTNEGDAVWLSGGNVYTQSDQVCRGDLTFVKLGGDTQNPLGCVKFSLTSQTTGESHVFWTDQNGQFSTASDWQPHSKNTNAGESWEDGVWFYGSADGADSGAATDDSIGALPCDTYLLTELPCEANEGRTLISTTVTIYRDGVTVNLGTLYNYPIGEPGIGTTLTEEASGSHEVVIPEDADRSIRLIDAVSYYGLDTQGTYYIVGVLMDAETGEALTDVYGELVTAESAPFSAPTGEGYVEVAFEFFADKACTGRTVAFEYLYNADTGEWVAEHTDLKDEGQTVTLAAQKSEPDAAPEAPADTPSSPAPAAPTSVIQTGDVSTVMWIVVIAAASACLILGLALRSNKKSL